MALGSAPIVGVAGDVPNLILKGVLAGGVVPVPASRVLDDLVAIVIVWVAAIVAPIRIQVGLEEGMAAAITKQPETGRVCASRLQTLKGLLVVVVARPCTGVVQFASYVLHVSGVFSVRNNGCESHLY